MIYTPKLLKAIFIKRYKRFLADVRLADGTQLTVHCPNTGSMKNCLVPESTCWISDSENDKRKYRFSLEYVTTADGGLAGINTHRANFLVYEALQNGLIVELDGFTKIRKEVKYGKENSRIDFLLTDPLDNMECFVEVKSVTLAQSIAQLGAVEMASLGGASQGDKSKCLGGFFPDSISARGTKHLRELIAVCRQGKKAALVFCVQHTQIQSVTPAMHIDKEYGTTLKAAIAAGVKVMAYKIGLKYTGDGMIEAVALETSIPFNLMLA